MMMTVSLFLLGTLWSVDKLTTQYMGYCKRDEHGWLNQVAVSTSIQFINKVEPPSLVDIMLVPEMHVCWTTDRITAVNKKGSSQ